MSSVATWWARICAVVTTATLAVFVPAAAWAASTGVDELAYEAARRRRGGGIVGVLGLLCCLGVVAIVVIAVLMIKRGRQRKG